VNPNLSVTVNSETLCAGETATLTATVSGGTAPYTYSWSNGETTQTIQVSPEETTDYTVTVSKDGFCADEATGTVTVNPNLSVTVNSETLCAGETATLTATVSGGTAPYTYSWSNGETTQTIQVSPEETTDYTVTVSKDGFCADEATGTVTVNPNLSVTVNSETLCAGETATLTATVSGGTAPYTYSWSNGETTQTIQVSPEETTDYTVTVSKDGFCADEATGTVTVNPNLSVTVNSETICAGETVTLTATVSGGTAPYTYSWSNGETTQTIQVSPEETTDYTVTVSKAGFLR
jgi:creatinine amidohydrolase/Fe(II)-dependent formamide hydrolase-like protein